MSVFPAVTATLFFRYTVVYYGFGVFFAVFAAWILPRHPWGIVASAVSIACSLGIYQAYIPITISILILVLIQEGMHAQADGWKMIRNGLHDCLALLLGLATYYLILQGMLKIYGTSLSDYQGMDTMGRIPLTQLPALVKETVYSVVMLPIRDYCGLSSMRLIKVVYLLLAGTSAVAIVYAMVAVVRKWFVAFIQLGLCFLLLVAVNFIVIMCPESWIYTLMVYSFVLLPCVPLVLVQALAKQSGKKMGLLDVAKKGCIACVAVLVLSYGYEANIQYTMADYTGHQVENYMQSLVAQIRMTEGFTAEKRWAFLGQIHDPLMRNYWEYELRYGGVPAMEDLLNRYSREEWIRNYLGYSPDFLAKDELESLAEAEAVKAMPCWPSQGSIQVIGDTVVVKFQDLEHM